MKRLFLISLLLFFSVVPVSHATVTTGTRTVTYSPTSATSLFAVPFPFLAKSHLQVVRTVEATGADTTLTLNSDYSVSLPTAGNLNGSVTLSVPIGSAFTLTITRVVPVTQEVAFSSQGTYNAQRVEDAFDKLTMILQQLQAVAGTGESVETHEGQSDAHSQYALLPGRSGGQTLYGGTDSGDDLTLNSTSNATKGFIYFGANSAFDETNDYLGIGTATPSATLDLIGDAELGGALEVTGGATIGFAGPPTGGDLIEIGDANFALVWTEAGPRIRFEGTSSEFAYGNTANDLDLDLNDVDVFNADDTRLNIQVPLTLNIDTPTSGIEFEVNGEMAIDTEFIVEGFDDSGGESSVAVHKATTAGVLNVSAANAIGSVESTGEAFINLYGSGYGDSTKQGAIVINTDTSGDGLILQGGDFTVTNGAFRANRPIKSIGPSTSLSRTDCNSVVMSTQSAAASAVTVSLPGDSSANPIDGCVITLIATDADPHWTVSPASGDKIEGPCTIDSGTAENIIYYFPGTTSRSIELDDSTSNVGDYWTGVFDGVDTWYTIGCVGFDDVP